ncbi:MAG: hypothetical protein A2157_14145 [Deltaproteobacteria bacterium RBG_16_47_11]|mgnify:CR=1 FL=1|nr:MAG: hypothetical protein A2157_14145 [Deltaproteobacteria bacterium RBG_16_47_11]
MPRVVKEEKRGKWSSDLVLDLYSNLLTEIWELVSALIGEAILAFLVASAVRKLGEKYPFLNSLTVSEDGISLDEMKENCRTVAPLEIHRGFQSLINHLSHLFSVLAEGVINKELFPKVFQKVKEAERIISPK